MNTKVINLFGGPGAGKSTCASGLFYLMKKDGIRCEIANEWIKEKVYEENSYVLGDQMYVFAKQRKKLVQLMGKVEYIITDSPLLLSVIYGDKSGIFNSLVVEEFNKFVNLNFLIVRDHQYQMHGRMQDEGQAQDISQMIASILNYKQIEYKDISSRNSAEEIYKCVKGEKR